MRKNPLDFCKKTLEKLKNNYKNRRIKLITALLIIVSCFFYGNYVKRVFVSDVRAKEAKGLSFEEKIIIKQSFDLKEVGEYDDLERIFAGEKGSDLENIPNELEMEIANITKNHPIEEMAPYIAKYDKKVAALIVGIAKKESNWGIHSPSKNGKTCYNYWGYKGYGSKGVSLGYSCFDNPEEAVRAIGGRIEELVNKKIDTPQKMVVWKCGSSCAGHDPAGVRKWISDVSLYYNKITKAAS